MKKWDRGHATSAVSVIKASSSVSDFNSSNNKGATNDSKSCYKPTPQLSLAAACDSQTNRINYASHSTGSETDALSYFKTKKLWNIIMKYEETIVERWNFVKFHQQKSPLLYNSMQKYAFLKLFSRKKSILSTNTILVFGSLVQYNGYSALVMRRLHFNLIGPPSLIFWFPVELARRLNQRCENEAVPPGH